MTATKSKPITKPKKTTPSKAVLAAKKKEEGVKKKKKAFLEVLKKKAGNISSACDAVGISRQTYYNWKDSDKQFNIDVENVEEALVDFSESMLLKKIAEGDTVATIFHLKTKGKKRGYTEKSEVQTVGELQVTLPEGME